MFYSIHHRTELNFINEVHGVCVAIYHSSQVLCYMTNWNSLVAQLLLENGNYSLNAFNYLLVSDHTLHMYNTIPNNS